MNPNSQVLNGRTAWRICVAVAAAWVVAMESRSVCGADWPSYRGPTHDGVSVESIRLDWSVQAPKVLWRVPMRNGFSSFAVAGGRAVTLVERRVGNETQELCVALDADTGVELWARRVDTADQYDGTGITGATGPRSTPVIAGDRVYVLSAYLGLWCLDAATGAVVWQHDLVAEYGSGVISWQSAAAPLVDGDRVFVMCDTTSRSLIAFDRHTGAELWARHGDRMTHATPVAVTLNDVRQILFYTQTGLVSVKPENGDVLWRHAIRYNGTSAGASPVVAGDLIYCSRAYPGSLTRAQAGAVVAKLSRNTAGTFSTTQPWTKVNQLMNHWATPIHHDGHLFGIYGQYNSGGSSIDLKCIEMATGNEKWSVSLSGQGSRSGGLVKVGGKILLLAENGDLVVFEPDPAMYREIARFKALTSKAWNVPAVSGGRIYARSTTEAVCLDVSMKPLPRLIPQPTLAGTATSRTFELQLTTEDGTPIDSARQASIEIYASPDPAAPISAWQRVTEPGVLADGVLRFADPASGRTPSRFFKVLEK